MDSESLLAAHKNDIGPVPRDRHHGVLAACFYLGLALLLPYNTIVSASNFFKIVFPHGNIPFLVPILSEYPAVVVLLVNLRWGNKVSASKQIVATSILNALVVACIALFADATALISSSSRLWLVYGLIFLAGSATSLLQAAIFGLVAQFPKQYVQAVQVGIAFGGVLSSVGRIASLAAFPHATQHGDLQSAKVFFIVSAALSALAIVVFLQMRRSPFARYFWRSAEKKTSRVNDSPQNGENQLSIREVFERSRYLLACLALIFFVTFLYFPGVLAGLKPSSGMSQEWFTVLLIAEFNLGDCFGRWCSDWCQHTKIGRFFFGRRTLFRGCLVRLLPYAGFLLLSQGVWTSDILAHSLSIISGLSQGLATSLVFMFSPSQVESHQLETQGTLLALVLLVAICVGGAVAVALHELGLG